MSLTYIDWDRNGILVICLVGEIKLGKGTGLVRQLIDDVLALGRKDLILNLGEVTYMDSSGLGELVAAHQRFTRAGGRLKLAKLSRGSQQLMQSTQLYLVFDIFPDEDAAVRSFGETAGN